MGILEIHFHDSEFSWSVNSGTGEERSLSVGSSDSDRPALAPKLLSVAIVALVVGAGVAYNRLADRRAREAAGAEQSGSGRLSRLRSR